MATAPPSARTAKTVIAKIPYLNCAPFFTGFPADEAWAWAELPPRQFGAQAAEGKIDAGPMSLVDFLRLQDRFERLSNLGIATSGRSGSAMLFSRVPIRLLDERVIAVTDESSTTALLLRLILEQRYRLTPKSYQRGAGQDADAVLLIGDEALKFRAANRLYPYETDLAFEWWLWQHLPFVFAVWAVRRDLDSDAKARFTKALFKTLALNAPRLGELGGERASVIGLPAAELKAYLEGFTYRFSDREEQAIQRFTQLAKEQHLL